MHIPDNYLSPQTCAAMTVAMVPIWSVAVKKVKQEVTTTKMPLLGVGAAYSFLIMMFNIPVMGGSTVHAVGGTLIAVLVGPWAACISMTVALLLQALVFGDGGILAFGANCFNLAFVLPFVGYYSYRLLDGFLTGKKGNLAALAIGAYVSINIAALFAAIEFGIQPLLFQSEAGMPLYCPYPLSISIPAMMIPHLLIAGLAEAAFTVAVYSFLRQVSPEILQEQKRERLGPVLALLAVMIVLTPIGLLATGTAWGEWELKGVRNEFRYESLIPDYAITGMPEIAGYLLSAVAGTAIMILLFKLFSGLKKSR